MVNESRGEPACSPWLNLMALSLRVRAPWVAQAEYFVQVFRNSTLILNQSKW
ncbi:MAG: hypothetical protein KAI83_12255 [Thiomargarita sp.]|nr:hypothetical protein [Thiomargarita sp.]